MKTVDFQKRINMALSIASEFGQFEGEHHKTWVIDQMVRALTNCPSIETRILDESGQAYILKTLGKSDEYSQFVTTYSHGDHRLRTEIWDTGVEP